MQGGGRVQPRLDVDTRCALRALCGDVLEDLLVVFACDDNDVRLGMQWHGHINRKRSGFVVPRLNRQRSPIVLFGAKNTTGSCENTLREQCKVP